MFTSMGIRAQNSWLVKHVSFISILDIVIIFTVIQNYVQTFCGMELLRNSCILCEK